MLDVSHLERIDLRGAVAGAALDFIVIGMDIRRTTGFNEVNRRVQRALADARMRYHDMVAQALKRDLRNQWFAWAAALLCCVLLFVWVNFLSGVSDVGFRGVGGSLPPTSIV